MARRFNVFLLGVVLFYVILVHLIYNQQSVTSNKTSEFEPLDERENIVIVRNDLFKPPDYNLAKIVSDYNINQYIINRDIFGPLSNDDYVIVIQVHNRIDYLRFVIESHSKAKGIENVLLIFSHDYFDDEINSLIQSITFCKVMQIFYPYSMQIYPDKFPGTDPNDCLTHIAKQRALDIKCNNANSPDSYGNYREAAVTQIKHHWWWKINAVFQNIDVIKNFNGLVVLLEEDHYVLEDYLYMLNKMYKLCLNGQCNLISLGKDNGAKSYGLTEKVELSTGIHNFGIAINRTTWSYIQTCAYEFCYFDDYNWDWTLLYISQVCLKKPLQTLTPVSSRVNHIGNCGVHAKLDCDVSLPVEKIQKEAATFTLYPEELIIKNVPFHYIRRNFGGWGDSRDHSLCLNMTLRGNKDSK